MASDPLNLVPETRWTPQDAVKFFDFECRESGKAQAAAKTQTARFKEMQETVGRRLTCGKSAIHGLGAFTKQQHRPGRLHDPTAQQHLILKSCQLYKQ